MIYKKNLTREECENAVDEICQLCHKDHINKYGKDALGCAFQSFDNTYCDKVVIFKSLIKEHFDNPPLKFKELKKNMWIWDNKNKCWLYLFKPLDWEPIKGLRYAERIIEYSAEGYYMDFEEGRFYKRKVEE